MGSNWLRWFFLLWGTHAPGPQSEGKIQILDQGFELADVAQGKRNAGRRLVVTRRKRRRSRLGAAVAAIKIKLRVSNELGVCFLESLDWQLYSAPSHPFAAVRFANEVRRTRDPRLVRSCLPRVGATFALGAWEVSAADPPGETKRLGRRTAAVRQRPARMRRPSSRQFVVPPPSEPASTQRAPKHGCVRGSSKTGVSGIGRTGLAPRVIGHCRLGCRRAWGWQTRMAGWLESWIAAFGWPTGLGVWGAEHQSILADSLPARQSSVSRQRCRQSLSQ